MAWIAPELAGARPLRVSEVFGLIALLSVPAAFGLLIGPWVIRIAPSRVAMGVMIAGGVVMRLVWFGVPAPLEDDYHRYLWDGAVVAAGGNPYSVAPAVVLSGGAVPGVLVGLRGAGAGTLAAINFPDLTTIYPGVAQAVFAAAHWVWPWSLDGLRVVFLVADAGALWVLLAMLGALGQSPMMAALYWLNPLVVFAVFGTGHVDGVLVGLIAGSLLAVCSGWPVAAALLLGLSVGVKIWPVVLAPLVAAQIWRRGTRVALSALVFAGVCFAALGALIVSWMTAATGSSGLAAYAGGWANNNGVFAWASYALYLAVGGSGVAQVGLRAVAALVVVGVAIWAGMQRAGRARDVVGLALIVTASVFYLQPAQFPWYALGFLPLAAVLGCWPLLLASVTLPAYYAFFPLWNSGAGDTFTYGVAFVHAVPVWAWLAVWAWTARARAKSIVLEPVHG